jgi:hypothetical protein
MRTAALLALVAILCFGLFFLLNGPQEGPSKSEKPLVVEAHSPEIAQAPPVELPSVPLLERVSIFEGLDIENLPSLPEGEGVRIELQAILRENGSSEPVADARVWVLDRGLIDETQVMEAMVAQGDIAGVLRLLGSPYRSDHTGAVVVPSPTKDLIVAASIPGFSGFALPAERDADGVIRILLEPNHLLDVLVVDEKGQPVSKIPVAVRIGDQDLLRAETGASGWARFEDLSVLSDLGLRENLFVGIGALIDAPIEIPLDLNHDPGQQLVLHTPPLGSVRVELDQKEHLRFDNIPQAALMLASYTGDEGPSSQVLVANFEEGAATFPHVGLHLDLRAKAYRLSDRKTWLAHFSGPALPEEEVIALLKPDPNEVAVKLHLLDQTGKALAESRLQITMGGPESRPFRPNKYGVNTNATGDLRVAIPNSPALGEQISLRIERPGDAEFGQSALHGEVAIAGPLRPGENDLGQLQLLTTPLIASGIVVDLDGKPIAGVSIRPEAQRVSSRGSISWRPRMRMTVRTDEKGRFVLRGKLPAGIWRLRAQANGWAETTPEFPLGANRLVLTMARSAHFTTRLLVDEGIPVQKLQLHLSIVKSDGTETWQGGQPTSAGTISWNQLPAGRGTFTISAEQGEILTSIEGIDLTAGQLVEDPRCREIDLRGQLSSFRLEFLDSQGARVPRVTLTSPGANGVSWQAYYGTLDVITRKAPLDLITTVPGFRSQVLTGISESQSTTLVRGPKLMLSVSNLEFIPSTVSLVAWMGGEKPLGEQIINEEGIGILWATEPGSHTLRLGLKQGRRIIPLSSVIQVEIAESPVPNETSIRLDENAVSAALEALESSR